MDILETYKDTILSVTGIIVGLVMFGIFAVKYENLAITILNGIFK